MPVFSSVTTAKGVTSLPVPLVVGMHTMRAFLPSSGTSYTRLRMSWRWAEGGRQAGVRRRAGRAWAAEGSDEGE